MADKNEKSESESEAAEQGTSIFDLFEPPPERDADSFGKIPVIKDDEIDLTDSGSAAEVKAAADVEAAGLQHWTAPPTGQVPAVLSDKDESGLWADVKGPSWHGDDPSWAGPDLADVFADTDSVNLAASDEDFEDDEEDYDEDDDLYEEVAVPRPVRAVGSAAAMQPDDQDPGIAPARPERSAPAGPRPTPQTRPPVAEPQVRAVDPPRPRAIPAPAPAAAAAEQVPPVRHDRPPVRAEANGTVGQQEAASILDRAEVAPPVRVEQVVAGAESRLERPLPIERPALAPLNRERSAPNIDDIEFASDEEEYYDEELDEHDDGLNYGPVGGRNLPQAIGVGLALVGIVLAAMFFGAETTLALVVVLALLAVLELYNAMRMAGLRPATLLGIVGTVAAPAAAFYRGDAAFPLIVALTVVFGTLWYLVGADTERPVLNLSLTMMGIFWVGGLAAFGALMISQDGGIELLLATIIITVASDTMAYIGGRAYGSRPFHHASPNKTWEGTITGFAGAMFAGFAIGVTEMGSLWDTNLVPAIVLGAVVGCLAPMGDLAESVVKRDLGVKDMGTLLPGHGGVLDRLDGLLFALPGAYYLALVYGLI